MDTTLAALADPIRRTLIDSLLGGERSAGEIEHLAGLTQPATSRHLRALREAGLVSVRKQAQRRLYSLNPTPLAELDAWLAPYRAFWSHRLDALERHLDEEI